MKFLNHHTHIVTGERERAAAEIERFLVDEFAFNLSKNPDFFREQFDILGIDDARRIKTIHTSRPFGNDRRVFLILTNGFTLEAQNALLKIFEEPQPDNHFFVVMPSAQTLLPTLRSRVVIVALEDDQTDADILKPNQTISEIKNFIDSSIKDRMKFVADFASDISDDKKTKADAITFLNNLESYFRDQNEPQNWSAKEINTFETIAHARDYLYDRASSVKMLLEHVALVM